VLLELIDVDYDILGNLLITITLLVGDNAVLFID